MPEGINTLLEQNLSTAVTLVPVYTVQLDNSCAVYHLHSSQKPYPTVCYLCFTTHAFKKLHVKKKFSDSLAV